MFKSEPKTIGLGANIPCFFEPLEVRAMLANPTVASVTPLDKATNVSIDTFIACDVNLVGPGQVVDSVSVTKPGNVTLVRVSDGVGVPGDANTSGGGDSIVFTPSQSLDLNTKYRFTVTAGVKDTAGRSFIPFSSTFTTAITAPTAPPKDYRFDKIPLPNATGKEFTSVAVGPDHRLYVADLTGYIIRYDILDNGELGASKTFSTVRTNNGGSRLITGLLFAGSKKRPDVYVSHGFSSVLNSPDHTGKISKLTGSNLENYQDLVTNLPRSAKDHLTNQMAFGPDGAIYISQGSMTAMGAPDNAWGLRNEHLLAGAVLRLDLSKLTSTPLNVKTADGGGSYDPFAANAPLTIYATGVRNAYDLVWTDDGHLFAPTNGSAGGGNTPTGTGPYTNTRIDAGTNGAYTGPDVTGLSGVPSQFDYLFDIKKNGYYGHPNPLRDEYVMNGGNPTSGSDPGEVAQYPVGTQPDRNYRGFAYQFDLHASADGVIEYHGNAFGGKLKGDLLVAQYSGGDNIIRLDRSGASISKGVQNIVGFTGFIDPLDMAEDRTNGNIYVAEFGGKRITLLRPDESSLSSGSQVTTDQGTMFFSDVISGKAGQSQVLIVKNKGDQPLTITQLTLTGSEPDQFSIAQRPPLPIKLQPGASTSVRIAYNAGAGTTQGIHTGTLRIKSKDSNSGTTRADFNVALRGFAQSTVEGNGEPSLQQLMDLFQIPLNVGDKNPNDPTLTLPPAKPNDEIIAQTLTRADSTKLVSIEPLASFAPASNPQATVGYYSAADGTQAPLFDLLPASYQQVDLRITGTQQFSPGTRPFGLYVFSQNYNHASFSQDKKNTWAAGGPANQRMLRFYPLKKGDGSTVANAYVVAVENFSRGSDQQDLLYIIRNVKPTTEQPPAGTPDTTRPATPKSLAVLGTTGAITLDWANNTEDDLAGYVVKRSTNSLTGFIQLHNGLLGSSTLVDNTAGPKKYYYRVFAQDTSGNVSDPAKISATRSVSSAPPVQGLVLNSLDIGNPKPAGKTNVLVSGNAYDVIAGGADIQGTSDQFRFAYKQITGNFDIKVKVESLTATDVWAKAGIMVRKTLDANARNIFVLTSPTKYRLTYRVNPGDNTTATGSGTPKFPNNWLRLSRVGNVYTGYSSTNGKTWTPISSVTMNLGNTLYVGLAATSHNTSKATTVQFRNVV